VRGLETEYEGRVRFTVVPQSEGKLPAAVEEYGFGDARHGLVTFGPDGETVGTIPGHRYGRDEIVVKVGELLDASK